MPGDALPADELPRQGQGGPPMASADLRLPEPSPDIILDLLFALAADPPDGTDPEVAPAHARLAGMQRIFEWILDRGRVLPRPDTLKRLVRSEAEREDLHELVESVIRCLASDRARGGRLPAICNLAPPGEVATVHGVILFRVLEAILKETCAAEPAKVVLSVRREGRGPSRAPLIRFLIRAGSVAELPDSRAWEELLGGNIRSPLESASLKLTRLLVRDLLGGREFLVQSMEQGLYVRLSFPELQEPGGRSSCHT